MPEPQAASLTCPRCAGLGTIGAFSHDGRGSRFDPAVRCPNCRGTGTTTAERLDWHRRGTVLRQARVARQESLRDAAARLGLQPVDLSAMEHGRADPAPLEARTP